jgi:tetratricopeptide (TPR) repeat protein
MTKVAPMTEVPAFCNFCFKHIVQSSWAGDVKFCQICHFTVCASCLRSLEKNPEKRDNSDTCAAISSLNVRLGILFSSTSSSDCSDFCMQGVHISWFRWFKLRWENQYRSWTTEEVVNMLIRPRTFISRRKFCEELAFDGDMQHFTGPANLFVCHSWKSSFSGLIDGLLDTIHDNHAILWIDAFSMQLHHFSSQNDDYHFDDVKLIMSRMKSFSVSLQPLMQPATFENRWLAIDALPVSLFCFSITSFCVHRCLFEIVMYLHAQPSSAIDAVLNPKDFQQLSSRLHNLSYASSIERAFAKVQIANSNSAHYIRAPTEALVPSGMNTTCLCLNESIFNGVRSWLIKTLMIHVDKGIQKNDDFYLNSLMMAVSQFFQKTDDVPSLLPFVTKFLNYKHARFGEFHAETVVQMFEHAKLIHKMQLYHEAASLYHKCLHVKGVISGLQDTTVLSVKNELAVILLKFYSIDAAFTLLETCVLNRRLLLGDDHPDTLDSEFYLSSALSAKNQHDAALLLIESCLQKRMRLFGLDHPVTLQTFSCQAQLAFKHLSHSKPAASQLGSGQKEIDRLFTICLIKQENIVGKFHEDTVLTRNNLALACSAFGDLKRARALFSECLDIIQSRLGANHISKFSTIRCSASVAVAAGEVHVAERLYADCLQALRKIFGIRHPTTLMTIEDLGHVYVLLQKFDDASSLFQECSDAWASMGYPSRSLSIDMYRAATLRIQGNLSRAHSVAYQSLLQSHSRLGPAHSTTEGLEVELADILHAASRWTEAKVLLKKVLENKLSVDGPEHLSVIRLMSKLASVYGKLKKYAKSRNLLTFVYNHFVRSFGSYHPDTIDIMANLARCMYLCDDLEDCEALAMACLDRCWSLRLQNVEDQQHLRTIIDAARRRRARIISFEKESDDDLVLAVNFSMTIK